MSCSYTNKELQRWERIWPPTDFYDCLVTVTVSAKQQSILCQTIFCCCLSGFLPTLTKLMTKPDAFFCSENRSFTIHRVVVRASGLTTQCMTSCVHSLEEKSCSSCFFTQLFCVNIPLFLSQQLGIWLSFSCVDKNPKTDPSTSFP